MSRRWLLTLALVVAASIAGVSAGALVLLSNEAPVAGDGVLQAAILDQLSLYAPNEEFVQDTTALMEESGYNVEYAGGHDVTVDLFRQLPTKRYDLIIIRGHSGISRKVDSESGIVTETEYVSLSTGELYYRYLHEREQSKGLLGSSVVEEDKAPVFGFGYEFVEQEMRGNFAGALIVMMGCDGLRTRDTAQAFLDRGASAFVSWSQPVSVYQTDRTTRILVEKLLAPQMDVQEAVAAAAEQVGPDPWYGGELRIVQ